MQIIHKCSLLVRIVLNHLFLGNFPFHFKNAAIGNNGELYYKVLKKISKTHQAFYVRCNANINNKSIFKGKESR